jgi:hypothetical protein
MNKMILYQLEMDDPYNSKIYGGVEGFCFGDVCKISDIRIIGNPGHYKLIFKLLSFGRFSAFKNTTTEIDINIKVCNTTKYIEKYINDGNIKSCHLPFCNPSCNSGECINDNICNCTNPFFTGKHCNEYYQLKKSKLLNIIFMIISLILIMVSIILIGLIILFKLNVIIKAAGPELLIVILIGTIFNYIYVFILALRKTRITCTLIYLLKNLGFSLVYGSFLVKNLRVYLIINSNILKYRFKNIYTVYIISIITTYHIIVTIIWTITNSIYTEKVLDESYKEYIECFYPRFEMISSLFNSIILAIGCYFAYETRYAEKRYTESLSIPIYVYLIYHIYSEFLYYQVNVSIKPKDLINSIGTIVYSIIVIKYVYIDKLIYIYSRYCNYMKIKKHENYHYQLKF